MVNVSEVAESVRTHGERYLDRVYTSREVTDCSERQEVDAERLAARFAAKEAAAKVLRPDGDALPWRAIEVRREPGGWVELELRDRAAELAARHGIGRLSVSLTHDAGLASAVVVGEVERP